MNLLTEENKELVKEWIEEKTPQLKCFLCGYSSWRLGDSAAMTVMIDTNTSRIHYMSGYPMIGLICKYCGHIVWFSAGVIGLKHSLDSADD